MVTAKRKRLDLDGDGRTEIIEEKVVPIVEKSEPSSKKSLKSFSNVSDGTDIGFAISIPIVGGVLLGAFLDKKLNTSPKLTLSFLFLGIILSFINIIKIVNDNK